MDDEPSIFDEVDQAAVDAAIAEGLADIEAGRTISHKATTRWLLSWGTDDDLAPPTVGD